MKLFENIQKEFKYWRTYKIGCDTFNLASKGKSKKMNNRIAHHRMKRRDKFYEGYEDFLNDKTAK